MDSISDKNSSPAFPEVGQEFAANLSIDMSGETVSYFDVMFRLVEFSEDKLRVEGTIPMQLEDFKVKRSSLMGVKVKNLCPVVVDATWTKSMEMAEPEVEPEPETLFFSDLGFFTNSLCS